MDKASTHTHPQPARYRLAQYAGLALLIVMLLTVPLQLVLAATVGGVFGMTAFLTLLLAAPVVMGLSATPPVRVDAEGITIQPLIWPDRFIPWEDVLEVKDYTLLPSPNNEVGRKVMEGRKKYRAAEGKMLIVRGLPFPYYVTAFFAGERGRAIIALTNRTHSDYDRLIRTVNRYAPQA